MKATIAGQEVKKGRPRSPLSLTVPFHRVSAESKSTRGLHQVKRTVGRPLY